MESGCVPTESAYYLLIHYYFFYHLLTYRFITMFAYPTALSYQQHEGALLQFGVKGGGVTKGISEMCHELSQLQRDCLID